MKRLTQKNTELLDEEVETGEPMQSETPNRVASPLEKKALANKMKVRKKLKLFGKKKPKKTIKEKPLITGSSPFSQLLKNIKK